MPIFFTKAFHHKDKWNLARTLTNILDPGEIKQTINADPDLGANDKPKSVWEMPSGDEMTATIGGTGPAMEVDHEPQDSEALVACAAPPRANYPRRPGVGLKSMRSYVRTLIEVCCDAKSNMGIKFDEAKGVRHIRVTLQEAFLKTATVEWILTLIEGENTLCHEPVVPHGYI